MHGAVCCALGMLKYGVLDLHTFAMERSCLSRDKVQEPAGPGGRRHNETRLEFTHELS